MNQSAVVYCRLSEDKTGQALAVARQEKECRALAAQRGITVTDVFIDNDLSATSGVARPGFEALLASRPAAIIAWHQDRLLRLTADLERVIALDVPVYTVTAGTLDLSNPTGRAVARTVAAWSQFEGEQKAVRQAAKIRELVAAGLPVPGKRRYGFKPGNLAPDPVEADAVRDIFERFLEGASIRSLAVERGWMPRRLRDTLTNAAYAGTLTHRGTSYEAAATVARVVDRDTFDRAQALLAAPSRKISPGPTRRHLLSGIAECGIEGCGSTLAVTAGGYRCADSSAHVYIKGTAVLEAVAVRGLYAVLRDRSSGAGATPDSQRVAGLRESLDEVTAERARLTALASDPDFDADALRPRLRELRGEAEGLSSEIATAEAASVELRLLADLRASLPVVRESWASLHPSRRGADTGAARDALAEALGAFAVAFRALALEDQRSLFAGTVRVVLNPGRGTDRILITPR